LVQYGQYLPFRLHQAIITDLDTLCVDRGRSVLFNSFAFLFGFLPVALAAYHGLRIYGKQEWAKCALLLASLFFYGWWDVRYLPLIIISVLVNFVIGLILGQKINLRQSILIVGIIFNLGLLGYYKYANFFLTNLTELTGLSLTVRSIILPLGISFFTFQQIAYIVETSRDGGCERNIVNYGLFVIFFPHLIAGPITNPREMLPQFKIAGGRRLEVNQLNVGMVLLVLGLAKKVVIADTLALFANPIFSAAEAAQTVGASAAWMAALAYTFQLYFDFSGYSDMAIGLGLLFGIHLPVNFASPYKSKSIVEFWRRWHITLSRFLRNYIYIPLGGNRKGRGHRYLNLMLTMGLGGLWHGAGWTFMAWGLLHGVYLVINNVWFRIGKPLPSLLAWASTFLAAVIGWVLFRAATFSGAMQIFKGMFLLAPMGDQTVTTSIMGWVAIGVVGVISFLLPNSIELAGYVHMMPNDPSDHVPLTAIRWRPRPVLVAIGVGALAALAIAKLPDPGVFLYFNF
jgi:D-alanyl-lipoteichoic acid acyltransferase DltB (MBOAT superfamily)